MLILDATCNLYHWRCNDFDYLRCGYFTNVAGIFITFICILLWYERAQHTQEKTKKLTLGIDAKLFFLNNVNHYSHG